MFKNVRTKEIFTNISYFGRSKKMKRTDFSEKTIQDINLKRNNNNLN